MTVPTTLTSGGTSSAASVATASISPGASRLILITVHAYINAGSVQPSVPTVTGNGITYDLVLAQDTDNAGVDRGTIFVFRGMSASPTTGAITISFGATTMTRIEWEVDQSDANVSTIGTNGAGAIVQATGITLGAAATSASVNFSQVMRANSTGFSVWGHQTQEGKTPRAGWTELGDVFTVTLASLETQYIVGADTAGSASWTTSSRAGGIIIEIAAPPTLLLAWNADESSGDTLDISGNSRSLSFTSNNISRVTGKNGSGLQQASAGTTLGPTVTPLLTVARTMMFDLKVVSTAGNWWALEFYRSVSMSGANDTGIWGLLNLTGTSFGFRAKNSSNTPTDIAIAPDVGNWHNICATISGATMKVYRDGSLLSSATVTGGAWTSADTFRVFDQSGANAIIDNVRIYDADLDATTISALAGTAVTSPSTGSNVYFSSGAQASGIYEMTAGSVLVQRNSFVVK